MPARSSKSSACIHLRNERAGNLSGGQKRLLEFGRIRMAEPRLVILDEPMGGVNPVLGERMATAVLGFVTAGTSVDHRRTQPPVHRAGHRPGGGDGRGAGDRRGRRSTSSAATRPSSTLTSERCPPMTTLTPDPRPGGDARPSRPSTWPASPPGTGGRRSSRTSASARTAVPSPRSSGPTVRASRRCSRRSRV